MQKYAAGDQIPSKCSKCGGVTGHIIIALVDGEIAKVECRACKSVHKYRPEVPKQEAKSVVHRVKAGSDRKQVMAQKTTTSARVTKAQSAKLKDAEAIEKAWRKAVDFSGEAKEYSINGVFVADDLVEHSVFGQGVVQSVTQGKMKILFQDGIKLLKCSD